MDKKTIIYGLLAIAFVSVIVWYANSNKDILDQKASIIDTEEGESMGELVDSNSVILGDPNAPLTLIEYSSHFCGHCQAFHKETLPKIVEEYVKTGKLKIVQRMLSGVETGRALFCAAEQNAFARYNEYLFENVDKLVSPESLIELAVELEFDQDEFSNCANSEKYDTSVEEWYTAAQESEVKGTPTFYLGDKMIVGNQPYETFKEAIDAALAE